MQIESFFDEPTFVGDTLFMPGDGTARCDFPGGDAATPDRSIGRVPGLPPAQGNGVRCPKIALDLLRAIAPWVSTR